MTQDEQKELVEELAEQRIRLAIIENALFGRSETFWHSTGELADGTPVGAIGAMTHIIDPVTKRPMSKGYHTITPKFGGWYVGTVGAISEEFRCERLNK